MKYKSTFFLLFLSFALTGCFELGPKNESNPLVTKKDFQTIWTLNSIEIEGKRNGENTSRSFTGSTFQNGNGDFGYARIEFRENGRFVANIHINSQTTEPVDEIIEGSSFFSNNTMYTEAPSRLEWDKLAFKINLNQELFVEIKNYNTNDGGPFDNFYDQHTIARDTVRLGFVKYLR